MLSIIQCEVFEVRGLYGIHYCIGNVLIYAFKLNKGIKQNAKYTLIRVAPFLSFGRNENEAVKDRRTGRSMNCTIL